VDKWELKNLLNVYIMIEKRTTSVMRIVSGIAMLFCAFLLFLLCFGNANDFSKENLPSQIVILAIFLPFGLACSFLAWRLLRDGFSSARATLFPKWFFWCFGIFISILMCIAGYFHPVSIIPVVFSLLFTVISYKYRKK